MGRYIGSGLLTMLIIAIRYTHSLILSYRLPFEYPLIFSR